ncbi:hypothetical protein ATANTOWER_027890 [Ataeniobius toweri]|uniref:Uncharacterized protein n=1 Tax=Ataeniobius toweri TaxID=208326 RepID=A0ABU7BEH2_9TELE|nr:hypothetical protein [Ataeniobius toweri]
MGFDKFFITTNSTQLLHQKMQKCGHNFRSNKQAFLWPNIHCIKHSCSIATDDQWHHWGLDSPQLLQFPFEPLVFLKLVIFVLLDVVIATSITTTLFSALSTTMISGKLLVTCISV